MYLVNPLYYISNVIYIKPENRYILIERQCWNTMVRLIFKGRKPSFAELRDFKELCYQTYVIWMETKHIDYKLFNSKISQYQLNREDFKKWSACQQVASVSTEPMVQIDVNDDTFLEEEFIDEEKTHELELDDEQKKLLDKVSSFKSYEEDVKSLINYNLSLSPQHKALVDLIGFGKILSLARILVQSKSLRYVTPYQEKFLLNNVEVIYKALKLHDETLWFYCTVCKCINTHEHFKWKKLEEYNSEHNLRTIRYYYKGTPIEDLEFKLLLKPNVDFSGMTFSPAQLLEAINVPKVKVYDKLALVGMRLYVNIQDEGSLAINCQIDMDLYEYFYQFYFMKIMRSMFYDESEIYQISCCFSSGISRSKYFDRYIYERFLPFARLFSLDEAYFCSTFGIDRSCLNTTPDYEDYIRRALEAGPVENPFNSIMNRLN